MSSPPENLPSTESPRRLPEVAPTRGHPLSATRPNVSPGFAVWGALAIVYVIWGSTYLAIRIGVETIPPYLGAALRFGAAAPLLAVLLALRRGPGVLRITRRQFGGCAVVGVLLLTGGNGLVVAAESHHLPSGVAALLIATVPLLVIVLRAATGDRPGWRTVVGVLVGFGGLVWLIASRGGGGTVPLGPALVVVVAAASWSTGSFISRRLPLPADPFAASVYQMLAGAAALAVIGVLSGEPAKLAHGHISTRSWLALVYLTVAGSLVAYTSYVWLLRNAPISLVSTYAYVNPAVAVLLGALLVHERITTAVLASGAVILAGVALVVSTERRRRSDQA
jgi:drug/metabolite transporter (DMT)-like permease